jgi:hypothetical protein
MPSERSGNPCRNGTNLRQTGGMRLAPVASWGFPHPGRDLADPFGQVRDDDGPAHRPGAAASSSDPTHDGIVRQAHPDSTDRQGYPDGMTNSRSSAPAASRIETLCCSFCHKDKDAVAKLVAGPASTSATNAWLSAIRSSPSRRPSSARGTNDQTTSCSRAWRRFKLWCHRSTPPHTTMWASCAPEASAGPGSERPWACPSRQHGSGFPERTERRDQLPFP